MNRAQHNTQRPPAVAGMFYPAAPEALAAEVDACLARGAGRNDPSRPGAGAVISPHAGYRFSGWLAAAAWGATAGARPQSIVILSPSHRHGFEGIALPSQDRFAMPGFEVPVDAPARRALLAAGLAHVEDAAHDREHGVETQLPFLHRLHPGTPVVPLVIGQAAADAVAAAVDLLAGLRDRPPLFVLSSDLSHFLSLAAARTHDAETARLIETGQSGRLTPAHACGMQAVAGYLAAEHAGGTRVQRLAMANSHAASDDAGRTVGYGAWAVFDGATEIVAPNERAALLRAARQALSARLRHGRAPKTRIERFADPLQGHGAAFVTLRQEGRLRGCIGSLQAYRPLIHDVTENAVGAGFDDPRFAPLADGELADTGISIAVLSPPQRLSVSSQADLEARLEPGRDGLILREGKRRSTFLPMVWTSLPDPRAFIEGLKVKAGLPGDYWSDSLRIERYRAESFAEDMP